MQSRRRQWAAYLNVVFRELFREYSPTCGQRIDGVVDSDLPVLFVKEVIYVFTAFPQDLLA